MSDKKSGGKKTQDGASTKSFASSSLNKKGSTALKTKPILGAKPKPPTKR